MWEYKKSMYLCIEIFEVKVVKIRAEELSKIKVIIVIRS